MISLENIGKTYSTGKVSVEALRGVSLTIKERDMIAIMGPSGSGKSTLMNIIGCLDVPTSGSYRINGTEVATLTEDELAEVRSKNIGFVFQNFNLLPKLTALQNVELPMLLAGVNRAKRTKRAVELLTIVGLGDRLDHRPYELSGGQQQRVAIARALANKPHTILADEPTGALDSRSGEEIMEVFNHLNKEGLTIVLITHEGYIAEYANRVIHIKDGQIEHIEQLQHKHRHVIEKER
ncbi:MAG: ABC transporter ATP-binding protein [Actinobacteria bacterium]|nr:ABC transporter ATP-binding protein [Actinomycetota bacterium]